MNSTLSAMSQNIIGDPNIIGWLTFVAYLLTASACAAFAWRVERVFPLNYVTRHRVLWWGIALSLLLLGINKQLDFQTWLTSLGRDMAYTQGWYAVRRMFQVRFIIGIAGAGFIFIVFLFWTVRHALRSYWMVILGFVALVSFIVVRAASFHYVDIILGFQLAGFRLNWLIELGGIACVGMSAVLNLRRARLGIPFTSATDVGGVMYRTTAAGQPEVLLITNQQGYWTLPKGRIEPDEHEEDAIERVLLEKVGISGQIEQPLHQVIHQVNRRGQRERRTVSYYLVHAETTEPDCDVIEPTTQVGWFPLQAALRHIAHERAFKVVVAAQKLLSTPVRTQQVVEAY